jgi:hypothetical protein
MLAVDNGDASLCAKISPNATLVDLSGQTTLLRSRCHVALAYNTRDAVLCEQLPATGAFPYVNELYDSVETCRRVVAIYSRPGFNRGGLRDGPTAFPHPADFDKALQQIGYSRRFARTRVAKPNGEDYWQFLSTLSREGSAQERNGFLRRVMSLQ